MLARCCNQVVAFGRRSEALQSVVYGEGRARWMFQWVAASLPLLSLEKKGERQIGAVRWFDEYSDLGDDPTVTRDEMAREDQRLRSSYIWRSPVRKNVFDEILKHRHAFQHVRPHRYELRSSAIHGMITQCQCLRHRCTPDSKYWSI